MAFFPWESVHATSVLWNRLNMEPLCPKAADLVATFLWITACVLEIGGSLLLPGLLLSASVFLQQNEDPCVQAEEVLVARVKAPVPAAWNDRGGACSLSATM